MKHAATLPQVGLTNNKLDLISNLQKPAVYRTKNRKEAGRFTKNWVHRPT